MTKQYLVRAELAFGFQECIPTFTPLPVKMGPFQLDLSPNAGLYLADLGLIESHQISRDNYDPQFPMSLLHLEHNYTFSNDENPTKHADDVLDRLESLLRLFQPCEVSVLRHGVWHIDEAGDLTPAWSFSAYDFKPVKPPIEGLHEYGEYPLDDATLESLIEFIERFWDVLDDTPGNLKIAMARLSSSYEKRDLADRSSTWSLHWKPCSATVKPEVSRKSSPNVEPDGCARLNVSVTPHSVPSRSSTDTAAGLFMAIRIWGKTLQVSG